MLNIRIKGFEMNHQNLQEEISRSEIYNILDNMFEENRFEKLYNIDELEKNRKEMYSKLSGTSTQKRYAGHRYYYYLISYVFNNDLMNTHDKLLDTNDTYVYILYSEILYHFTDDDFMHSNDISLIDAINILKCQQRTQDFLNILNLFSVKHNFVSIELIICIIESILLRNKYIFNLFYLSKNKKNIINNYHDINRYKNGTKTYTHTLKTLVNKLKRKIELKTTCKEDNKLYNELITLFSWAKSNFNYVKQQHNNTIITKVVNDAINIGYKLVKNFRRNKDLSFIEFHNKRSIIKEIKANNSKLKILQKQHGSKNNSVYTITSDILYDKFKNQNSKNNMNFKFSDEEIQQAIDEAKNLMV